MICFSSSGFSLHVSCRHSAVVSTWLCLVMFSICSRLVTFLSVLYDIIGCAMFWLCSVIVVTCFERFGLGLLFVLVVVVYSYVFRSSLRIIVICMCSGLSYELSDLYDLCLSYVVRRF